MPNDPYAILQVPPDATPETIQSSYRRLAFQFHPDRNPERQPWAEEQMKRLNAAYAVVSSTNRRAEHDRRAGHDRKRAQHDARPNEYVPFTSPITSDPVRSKQADIIRERRRTSPYPPETENDWFFLQIYAQGRGVPEVEQRAAREIDESLRDFLRLTAPPDASEWAQFFDEALTRYGAFGRYEQFVARLTLRTLLPSLRGTADEKPDALMFRSLIIRTNNLMQDRMGTERLRMNDRGKNIVTEWCALLLSIVEYLWNEAAA